MTLRIMTMYSSLILLLFATLGVDQSYGQTTTNLDEVLALAIKDSYAARIAQNNKDQVNEAFKFYKSQLKPNVGLSADLPNFSKTSSPVIQPDGNIAFQSIRQANSSISALATQVLPSTGGTLFANSDLQRFDNFSIDANQYNGIPLRFGISQPLFGFNPWKFDKEIQPLLQEEAKLDYNIRIEEAMGVSTDLYFNILIARQNLEIAETNQLVNEKLLTITEERLILGKVSKDEKLQLEIELNNAKLSVSQATSQLLQSISSLYTYLGEDIPDTSTVFDVPDVMIQDEIDIDALLASYISNRPELIAYQRAMKETSKDLSQAKADYGFQANLQASIGLARGADNISDVYKDPFNEQQFNVSVYMPILDWGKKKSAMEQIKISQRGIEEGYQQQVLELENDIRQRGLLFSRLQTEVQLLKEIMAKADERFRISNDRYVLGNIDITNLTLAQREKDQTKRNYINALKSYWVTYAELRALSGYDVLKNQKINYQQ